jgi:cytochrome c biogenesis factor
MLRAAGLFAFGTVTLAWFSGVQNGWALALAGLAGLAAVAIMGCLWLDIRQSPKRWFGTKLVTTLTLKRRQYSGFLIHLGFVCLAIGIAGSSLGARREELTLVPGQSIAWAGRSLRFLQLHQTQLPDQLIVEAELELSDGGNHAVHLRPAQVWHRLNQEWTTEVDVHSTWGSDFYTVLQGGGTGDGIHISLVENPLIRCLWLGGYIMGAGALLAMWPVGANCGDRRPPAPVAAMPKFLIRSGRSVLLPGHSVRG